MPLNFLLLQTTGERASSAGARNIPKEKNRRLYSPDAIAALIVQVNLLLFTPVISAFIPILKPVGEMVFLYSTGASRFHRFSCDSSLQIRCSRP